MRRILGAFVPGDSGSVPLRPMLLMRGPHATATVQREVPPEQQAMDSLTRRHFPVVALLLLLAPISVLAAEPGEGVRRFLGVSPEQVAAFKQSLREFTHGLDAPGGDLYFQARYDLASSNSVATAPAALRTSAAELEDLRPPMGRDLNFEQDFLIAGREDEYEAAAKRWAAIALKGNGTQGGSSSAAHMTYAWNEGPLLGVTRGHISARAGWNGDWRIRYSRPIRSHPGWVARAWIGSSDGEEVAQFSIGRSLFASMRTK